MSSFCYHHQHPHFYLDRFLFILFILWQLPSLSHQTIPSRICQSQTDQLQAAQAQAALDPTASPQQYPYPPPSTDPYPETELVVSVCEENLQWIAQESTAFDQVTIYNKCGGVNNLSPLKDTKNLQVIQMANVGSADGAYLRHITTHYEQLAKYTVFCKGNNKISPSFLLKQLVLNHKKTNYTVPGSFICPYNTPVHPALRFASCFRLKTYKSFRNNPGRSEHFHQYKGREGTMGDWLTEVFGNNNITAQFFSMSKAKNGQFCREGYFAATRETVQKHPRYVYSAIHDMQQFANEEIDHYMERLWESLMLFPWSIECLPERDSDA